MSRVLISRWIRTCTHPELKGLPNQPDFPPSDAQKRPLPPTTGGSPAIEGRPTRGGEEKLREK